VVFLVPADGLRQTAGPRLDGPPAELSLDFGGIDRVAPIMARPVFHELDKGPGFSQRLQDRLDNLEVWAIVAGPDVVDLPCLPPEEHGKDGPAVVIHVNPVADIAAI